MLKKNLDEAIARLAGLYSGRGEDRIYAQMRVRSPTLALYARSHAGGETAYPELREREAFWRSLAEESRDIRDDSIPSAYMSEFDEGLYAGLLGAELRYLDNPASGWVSSMCVPFVEEVEGLSRLRIHEEGELAARYIEQLRFFKARGEGAYGISHFILIDGLNALLELRGATNMYYDCLDSPEAVREFLGFARDLNYWVQDRFLAEVGLFRGGTCSNLCQWIPGRIVSESLDPFHMAGAEFFEEWGRENVEEVFAHYDGGIVHLHTGNGLHLLEATASLKGIKTIAFIDEDFNPLKAFHQLERIDRERGDVPIHVAVPYEDFLALLESRSLPGKAFYSVEGVPDARAAGELMDEVRAYRAP